MNRRNLFTLAIPAVALAACTSITNGGKTTYSLDTAKIDQDGNAVIQAVSAVLMAPSIAIVLGPDNMAAAQSALTAARTAMVQFDALTTGQQQGLDFDTSSASALVTSLITNAQTALTLVQSVMPRLTGASATMVGNYVAAALALLPLLQVAANLAGVKAIRPIMSEKAALKIIHGS